MRAWQAERQVVLFVLWWECWFLMPRPAAEGPGEEYLMADMAELLSRAAETPLETALVSSVYTRRVLFFFLDSHTILHC